ncbi:MAG: cyclic nucleotide-binding domain-containing protein [Myxococcales bacterium]|nr:cyclic nucleotide-binding domain-containing protein [Myxococcales bacterium]
MSGTDAQPLFPQPEDGDPEDVGWALSTAEALWKRGEHADAVTWVRRAAEAASEAEQDVRMLVLVKAAGELAALAEAFANQPDVVPSEPAPPMPPELEPEMPAVPVAAAVPAVPPSTEAVEEEVEVPSGRLSTESIDLDLDSAAVESVEEPLAHKKPPKPPPRPVSKAPARNEPVPTPNPFPSPLRALAIKLPTAEDLPPPPPPLPHAANEDESLPHVPTVPPPPPDFAPTPMGLRAAPSVRPDGDTSRTGTAPFGVGAVPRPRPPARPAAPPRPALDSTGRSIVGANPDETPALGPALLAESEPAVRSRPNSTFPAAPKAEEAEAVVAEEAEPPSHRSVTPPMGSVPPKPLASLRPPAITHADGVQKHVSEAPPRAAATPAVNIPKAPRAPSVSEAKAADRPALVKLPTPRDGFPSTPAPPPASRAVPSARDIVLDPERFEVLADVPDDAREALVQASEKQVLLPDEQQVAPPMVVVLSGELEVRAPGYITRLDVIGQGQVRLLAALAPASGQLQLLGGPKGARYLAVPQEAVEALHVAAPWVVQELEPASDDVHVVAGALTGKLGARLDGGILDAVLSRAKTMRLAPHAPVVKQGEVVRALIFVGAGELSLRTGSDADAMEIGTLDPGEVLFPAELLAREPAPSTVRAGERGALVIVATRSATEEMLVTVPPLLELLGEG